MINRDFGFHTKGYFRTYGIIDADSKGGQEIRERILQFFIFIFLKMAFFPLEASSPFL